ncbi:MAG: damage-control phosphatase ARMT1 family protein [Verrucomicrobiales bacterium]|nr:ARMT1-like domain-containing protein [Verrucomicrobiota bacterium JB025]
MKAKLDCYSCFLRVGLQTARMAGASEAKQCELMAEFLDVLKTSMDNESPLAAVHRIQRIVCRETGVTDPYRDVKDKCDAEASRWLPHLQDEVAAAPAPLHAALKVAAIGNIMDYGAFANFDVGSLIERLHHSDFAIDASAEFTRRLDRARTVSYIADNAGEVVFDTVLITRLLDHHGIDTVRLVIRDTPFLNDVSCDAHLPDSLLHHPKVEILRLSVVSAQRDPDVWQSVTGSDIVISKGMANFENYSEQPGFFFLLIAKCDLVSSLIAKRTGTDVTTGDWIFLHG